MPSLFSRKSSSSSDKNLGHTKDKSAYVEVHSIAESQTSSEQPPKEKKLSDKDIEKSTWFLGGSFKI